MKQARLFAQGAVREAREPWFNPVLSRVPPAQLVLFLWWCHGTQVLTGARQVGYLGATPPPTPNFLEFQFNLEDREEAGLMALAPDKEMEAQSNENSWVLWD